MRRDQYSPKTFVSLVRLRGLTGAFIEHEERFRRSSSKVTAFYFGSSDLDILPEIVCSALNNEFLLPKTYKWGFQGHFIWLIFNLTEEVDSLHFMSMVQAAQNPNRPLSFWSYK